MGLVYKEIVIRSHPQLRGLVQLLEHRKFRRAEDNFIDIGRHITHVRLLTMRFISGNGFESDGNIGSSRTSVLRPGRETEWDRLCLDGGLEGSFISLFRRLLACCPRLQVIVDATEHRNDEIPHPFLRSVPSIEPLRANSSSSQTPRSNLRAIECTRGSPDLRDVFTNPSIANSLERLRGSTLHLPLNPSIPLALPKLLSLDIHFSAFHHTHFQELAALNYTATNALLPSLFHLTLRTPYCDVPTIGVAPMKSITAFVEKFGVGVKVLELIVGKDPMRQDDVLSFDTLVRRGRPNPMPAVNAGSASGGEAAQTDAEEESGMFDFRALLRHLPQLEDLILDLRLVLTLAPQAAPTPSSLSHTSYPETSCRRVGLRGSSISALIADLHDPRTMPSPSQDNSVRPALQSLSGLEHTLIHPPLPTSDIEAIEASFGTLLHLCRSQEIRLLPSEQDVFPSRSSCQVHGETSPYAQSKTEARVTRWKEICRRNGVVLMLP